MRLRSTVVMLGLACLPACGSSSAAPEGTGEERVRVGIEHSAFSLERSTFGSGEEVTFVIRNNDPIAHEFIIGDAEVHERHEEGSQRHHHGRIPGEISVPAGTTRTTTFRFDAEGDVLYACHLPGHFDYGMRGVVSVE
jgi:uncharacterized cupredoxin-like copper-binding protein